MQNIALFVNRDRDTELSATREVISLLKNYNKTVILDVALKNELDIPDLCYAKDNGIFEINNGNIKRLCDDRALLCDELAVEIKELSQKGKKIIIMGDGAELFYPFVKEFENTVLANEDNLYQNAKGVAFAAEEQFKNGDVISPEKLLPIYLRLPQAERELKLKKEQK